KADARDYRGNQINPRRGRYQKKGHDDGGYCVPDDLPGYFRFLSYHWQHRNARAAVVFLVLHRQCPRVRRRPEEDDEEENYCLPPAVWLAIHRIVTNNSPADKGWHAASKPTPNNAVFVLHLQPLGVDNHIEEVRQQHEKRSQPRMGHYPEPKHGQSQHNDCENRGIIAADFPSNQVTRTRALHLLIKLIFDHVIERVRCRSTHPSTEHGGYNEPNIIGSGFDTALGLQHGRNSGYKEELDDPRFCQSNIGLDGVQGIFLQL